MVPAVDLVDGTARSKWAVGARGGVSRCGNHAEEIRSYDICTLFHTQFEMSREIHQVKGQVITKSKNAMLK